MIQPLTGIRVLDLTSVLMGPYTTQLLGDMGADVIKVEARDGDSTRRIGPSRNDGMGAMFLNLNRNKRSIVLDLKHPSGRAAILRLAASCDLFVHSMRPETISRLGLDYPNICGVRPDVIYCGTYGYARNNPDHSRPAYDDLIQAASGMAALQGKLAGTEPQYVGTVLADKSAGLEATVAILAALMHRARTGEGQAVDVAMYETMAAFLMVEHLAGWTFEPPIGDAGYGRVLSSKRHPYKARDGYIAVLPYTDHHWRCFFTIAGRPELAADPRFSSLSVRSENIDSLYRLLEEIILGRTVLEWIDALDQVGIPVAPVRTFDEVIATGRTPRSDLLNLTDHPTEGAIWHIGSPMTFSHTPTSIRRHAPQLGRHGIEVLSEAGFVREEIEALRQLGVLVCNTEDDLG